MTPRIRASLAQNPSNNAVAWRRRLRYITARPLALGPSQFLKIDL